MYTRCPACNTVFRIRATQLSAAHGQVRCGGCGRAFDALQALADTPASLGAVRQEPDAEPDFMIPNEPDLRMDAAGLTDPELPDGISSRDADEPVDELLRPPNFRLDSEYESDVAAWANDDDSPRASRLWLAGAVVLLIVAAGQVSWFNRDVIYRHYPEVMPWAEQICIHLGCEVYRVRRPDAVELLDRDVRMHPVYDNVLLVNATIANRAGRHQPYPEIELALYDTDGRAIAYRRFKPDDYLDDSLPVAAGMSPDSPLHIVLEVSGPTMEAMSFEFGFL